MIRSGQGYGERKVLLGTTPLWPWQAPEAVKGGTTPALTFTLADGSTYSPALTVVRAADAVDGIDSSRTRLTASGAGLAALHRGIPGVDLGAAYVITGQDGVHAVNVVRVEDGAIVLAEPLRGVVVSAAVPATVQWATWTATVPAAVSAAETFEAPTSWTVTYTGSLGADAPDMPALATSGVVHVVRRLFQTGLTHHAFLAAARGFWPEAAPQAHQDWTPTIDAAFLRLVQDLRSRYRIGKRRAEDDLDGGAFLDVHIHLTAALARGYDAEEYARHTAEAARLLAVALHRVTATDSTALALENQGRQGADLAGGTFTGTADPSASSRRIGRGW